ncbi:MAG TPA: DUF882 domain-containing protein [Candidatus Binataceae bacterium]|nr:DUF882 domain-containing protein [Candidatus Binataceae bacterium]
MGNAGRKTASGRLDQIVSRRRIITTGALGAASMMLAGTAFAADWIRLPSSPLLSADHPDASRLRQARYFPPFVHSAPRALAMDNLHTGERIRTVYFEDGQYIPGALQEINYFFRDFRANEVKAIDPRLLDLLHAIHQNLDSSKPFNLISGYRTAATNAMLAARTEGVARHSMHILGRAADINVPDRQLSILQRVALALQFGGVGYYPQSDFVHVDTGRVRHWG